MERAVIGLNLCPFAKAVHVRQRIHWVRQDAADEADLRQCVEAQLQWLADADPDAVDTTLIVFSSALSDFMEFHWFVESLNALVKRMGLRGVIQVASFHPQYLFAGVDEQDRSHFTNRAPWPVVHLLRERSVERAVQSFPDADQIVDANIKRLASLSTKEFEEVFPPRA
jgi:hypothetical protein